MSSPAASSHTDISIWIGRKLERRDIVDERLIVEFQATLSPYIGLASPVPLGLHWCLAPDMLTSDRLGRDGHPRLGIFLPDLGLQRRMWAGGELVLHRDFNPGDAVTKSSTIEDIVVKSGKSGKLGFVTIRNHYSAEGQLIIDERQDIVYRESPAKTVGASETAKPPASPEPPESWTVTPTPTLLFRYSAMTFNGHRIHYDQPYARGVEGYDGLVVHGPLQATLMLNLAAKRLSRPPRRFSYRGLAPLTCGGPFTVAALPHDDGLETQIVSAMGTITMSGRAL
jgi:3-methylfumaryl-CoA hydratase